MRSLIKDNLFRRSYFILLFIVGFVSCSKAELTSPECVMQILQSIYDSDIFIDDIAIDKNIIRIILSDGQCCSISGDNVDIFSIGLNGFWYKNGVCTLDLTNEVGVDDLVVYNNRIEGGGLCAIGEDYKNWTFYFNKLPPIVIKKTVFSQDYDQEILSINHRGYNTQAPENTLPAFRLSRLRGFAYVEADVRFTSDGVPVLLHDASIDRTSNGCGLISDLTFEQVRQYDFGSWMSPSFENTRIPSLEEFLALCRELDLHPVLEIKNGSEEQVFQVVDMVGRYGLKDDTLYISFSLSHLMAVYKRYPYANQGYLVSKVTTDVVERVLEITTDYRHIALDSSDYSDSSVSICKSNGIPLWVWTLNSKEVIQNLNPYITAVTSDVIHSGRLLFHR